MPFPPSPGLMAYLQNLDNLKLLGISCIHLIMQLMYSTQQTY